MAVLLLTVRLGPSARAPPCPAAGRRGYGSGGGKQGRKGWGVGSNQMRASRYVTETYPRTTSHNPFLGPTYAKAIPTHAQGLKYTRCRGPEGTSSGIPSQVFGLTPIASPSSHPSRVVVGIGWRDIFHIAPANLISKGRPLV